ncbi:acetate--CoA ligase family protein [Pseudonocardia ailaonensis]|uniref:Acetate--CoA ligase family protein n=1 Tax=Pseudonocardia ailaonensis TaxID=367279 RepID=A0ABN2NAW7_9PSEU
MSELRSGLSAARLRAFFDPASVALVGASDRNDMSRQVDVNLRMHGYDRPVYYVNARAESVHGRPTVSSLSAAGGPVDLAFVLFGGDRVIEVAREAAAIGTKNLVVLSSGFDEVGEDGGRRQAELVEIARANDMLILGPNTIGFANLNDGVVLYGTQNDSPIKRGCVGVATQSGVLLSQTVRNLAASGVGMSVLAAVANESVIALHHMIDYFVDDEATKVIALFMETTRDAAGFRRAARRALEAGKPIVVLTGARTTVTADTAASHTGALVGDQRVREAMFDDLGIIMVTCLEDFYATTALLANYGPLHGRRVAFTSVSGGLCELFADRALEVGLTFPQFTAETQAELRKILPPFAATKNPLDYTGVAQSNRAFVADVLRVITADRNIDMVVYGDPKLEIVAAPDQLDGDEPGDVTAHPMYAVAEAVGAAVKASPIPVLAATTTYGAPHPLNAVMAERTGKGFEIGGSEHGPFALERAVWWTERRQRLLASAPGVIGSVPGLSVSPGSSLGESAVLDLLGAAGVATVPWALCSSRDDVVEAAEMFGHPVVVKIASPDIAHKSRIGGVVLDVQDGAAAAAAFDAVMQAARSAQPGAAFDGALVMPMRSGGLELIVGAKRDPTWGLVLVVGFGGVWTEVLADTAVLALPTTPERVIDKLRGLRGAGLFDGGHGRRPVDLEALAAQIVRVGDLAAALGAPLGSLDVNPMRVDGQVVEALDGLITWRKP